MVNWLNSIEQYHFDLHFIFSFQKCDWAAMMGYNEMLFQISILYAFVQFVPKSKLHFASLFRFIGICGKDQTINFAILTIITSEVGVRCKVNSVRCTVYYSS